MSTAYANQICLDPAALQREFADHNLPAGWQDRANTFTISTGREPGSGCILLSQAALDEIDLTKDHELKFFDFENPVRILKKITLLRAVCVLPNSEGDPESPFLCELVDRRWHLARIPINRGYNLKSSDGTSYLTASTNSGTPWTWATLIQDLFTILGIGTATLPFTPAGTPENYEFFHAHTWGESAWDALCFVLGAISCEISYDPATPDTFAIVRLGLTTAAGAVATAAELVRLHQQGLKTWDGYWHEPNRGNLPEKVRVLFPRRPVPIDGSSPLFAEDVTLSTAAGVVAGSYVSLFDGLTAVGTGTPSNAAALTTRASERATDWLRQRLYAEGRANKAYRDFQSSDKLLGERGGTVTYAGRAADLTEWTNGPRVLNRWLPVTASAATTSPTTYVRLTASGAGIDGETAWKGLIQKEVSGVVVDGDPVNADDFVLYATKAANGLVGNPEVGDIVHASPDPLLAGRWLFQPKLFTESRDCFSCGWVKYLEKGAVACLEAKNLGGYGACSCVLAEEEYFPMPIDDDLDMWARTKMMTTCCGCGLFTFDVDVSGNIVARIRGVHVSCVGSVSGNPQENSALVDIDLTLDCCGMEYDEEAEEVKPYFIVSGWSIKACSETGEGCIHYFRIKIRCQGECPGPVCEGCCDEDGAPATYKYGPLAGFDVATNNGLNGWWIAPYAGTFNGSPYWEGECDYSGLGGTISKLYYEPSDDTYTLNHGGAIYKADAATWDCGTSNDLTWVSGTSPGSQTTITVYPLGAYPSNECVFPETMYVSLDNPACPQLGSVTNFPVNRIGSTMAWQGVSGTRTVDVECFGGIFVMNATDQCPITLEPVSAASVGRPTRTHSPFEIEWDEVTFSTVAGGVVGCCDEESIGSATATAA